MLKVLVADDDVRVCRCLRNMIAWNELGFELIGEAYNGEEVLQFAAEHKIDVLITDVKMPVMNGLEVCKYFQTHFKQTAIILLSAYDDFEIAQEAIDYNVRKYILKPLTPEKLASIEQILAGIFGVRSHEQYAQYLLTDSDFVKDMFYKLESEDFNYFDTVFSELRHAYSDEYILVRSICLRMLDCLYEHLNNKGFQIDNLEKKRRQKHSEMNTANNVEKIVEIVRTQFQDVLQFKKEDKILYRQKLVNDIKNFINKNYNDAMLCRDMIAGEFSLHPGYLGQLFSKETGTTVTKYISEVRLNEAAKLLNTTDESVGKIGEKVGFASEKYFLKKFKECFGMTPGEYRTKQTIFSKRLGK